LAFPILGLATPEIPACRPARLDYPELQQTLLEGLAFLEDNQVRDRPGQGSPLRDSSDEGDGCRGRINLSLPCQENIGLPGCPVHNCTGEWASHYHLLPRRLGFRGRSIISVQDSNPYITASVAYGLQQFGDANLAEENRFISRMLQGAIVDIQAFKHHEAYNFWPALPGAESPFPRVGPLNTRVSSARKLAEAYLYQRPPVLVALATRGQQMAPRGWLAACLDPRCNPAGADALFNVPDDADDTALAVALQRLYARRCPESGIRPDLPALEQSALYRDLGRQKEDGRDAWKGRNSGAFLTWLKDENEPTFGNPETGVIPLGVNNVDAVVNANVAFALAVNDRKGLPGYGECLRLLAKVAEEHLWPEASIYFTQYMIFPYAVSRAYRDGGACEEPMRRAMQCLLCQILDAQVSWGKRHPSHWGAFPGGADSSDHLGTALGLSTLLNLGRPMACEIGQEERFDRGVLAAVAYLIRVRKRYQIVYPSTRQALGQTLRHGATWESGLFFVGEADMVHWRSQPFTAAAVLEALAKYAVAYDLPGCAPEERQLALITRSDCPNGLGLVVARRNRAE